MIQVFQYSSFMGLAKEQKNREPRICACGCGETFYPFPIYRPKKEGGGLAYPKCIRGHHPNCKNTTFGKTPAWNKGMKKGEHPSLERMGFRKGHQPYYITPKSLINPIDIRNNKKYKAFIKTILKRDKYTCQLCGDRNYKGRGGSIKLEVDHLVPVSIDPSRLCDETNVRTLCKSCHKKTDSYGGKMKKLKKKLLESSGAASASPS